MSQTLQQAVFGGGCFWCTEAIFNALQGVESVMPGYAGGSIDSPSYEQVCMGNTGHAEVIKIDFDPQKISFKTLLEVFFSTHDPTQLNRQGNDVGTQYRSVILYADETQKQQAQEFISELVHDKIFDRPIVTTLEPLKQFYPAEDYHRNYFKNNPTQPYCLVMINPKLDKFKKKYSHLLK